MLKWLFKLNAKKARKLQEIAKKSKDYVLYSDIEKGIYNACKHGYGYVTISHHPLSDELVKKLKDKGFIIERSQHGITTYIKWSENE